VLHKLTPALIFNVQKQFHQIYFPFRSTELAKSKVTLSVAVHYQLLNFGHEELSSHKRIQMKESVIISHMFIPHGLPFIIRMEQHTLQLIHCVLAPCGVNTLAVF
jgi:hypothetical protein